MDRSILWITSLIVALSLFGCVSSVPPGCINVTCNGVTACRDPGNIPPCAPSNAPCPDGYICGIPSDGCAQPGAIYNCPNEPVNSASQNKSEAVNLSQELNDSASAGFSLDQGMFYAISSSECVKMLISACDNNIPTQFICVNAQSSGKVSSQYRSIFPERRICPQFLLAGVVSCGLDNGYCVVVENPY